MKKTLFVCLVLTSLGAGTCRAQLRLARGFASHMVLQHDQPLNVWGWARPGETVTVTFNNQAFAGSTSADSSWQVALPAMPAGGPYAVKVSGKTTVVPLDDVYVGDVWFCSGQSNMEFRLHSAATAKTEIPAAHFPLIRQFDVAKNGAEQPLKDLANGRWSVCSPETAGDFSAVAYFFAKEINQKTNVPIGIIVSTWGGSDILAWMGASAVQTFPTAKAQVDALYPTYLADEKQRRRQLNQTYEQGFWRTIGHLTPEHNLVRDSFFAGGDWQPVQVPATFQSQQIPVKKGVVWLRKEVDLPAEVVNTESIALETDRLRETEVTFINGRQVGFTLIGGYQRKYNLPKGLLHEGKNELVIACYSESGQVGFTGIYLPKFTTPTDTLTIEGSWLYRQGVETQPGTLGHPEPLDIERKYPTLAYNAMIAPLVRYGVAGFLWYQGEQNASPAQCWDYDRMLSGLITSWRSSFDQRNAPFLVVQLPNYGKPENPPRPGAWAVLREQQTKVAAMLPRVACVTTIDIGNPVDIHPTNKRDVGHRLALVARNWVYGEPKLVVRGPTLASMTVQGTKVILDFTNVGKGLMSKTGLDTLSGFTLAGKDNVFYRASARLAGDHVIVFSEKVDHPVAVRYAFEASPATIDFYTKDGLPAVPFRTDMEKIDHL